MQKSSIALAVKTTRQALETERLELMKLTQQQLETHLWGAANILRGKTAGQDYKNYILSLMFYKRLCDQWEHEADDAIAEQEKIQDRKLTDKEKAIFRIRNNHRYRIPEGCQWGDVLAESVDIGKKLTAAMHSVAQENNELRGVFTVNWNLPAPDGSGRPLIPNEVVHALIQHFNAHDLSNQSVQPDLLGRAYEYLIKKFADDAGAKAGEFFTPPEVVDALVWMLEPKPGDTIYDPTCGSGGMLVHSADYLREHGHHATSARYFGQEMNWGNAAIGKINSVLHGLEADIRAGASTISDPAFTEGGRLKKFSLVLANFPFSDEFWWLQPEKQTDDKKNKDKLKKDIFGKEGYHDIYHRFGRGTPFRAPPAGYGDYAFILHILASLNDTGRAGVVCPQGVLFRGQPEVEEETGEFDAKGQPIIRRRKADDEHLIRQALVDAKLIDAIVSLPLNIFYGAGVPACLLILRKQREPARHDKLLMVYAARHFRELSAQNELRPQDVMRILVHYQAYGDAALVADLVAKHSGRIKAQITAREEDEAGRLLIEYQPYTVRLAQIETELAALNPARLNQTAERMPPPYSNAVEVPNNNSRRAATLCRQRSGSGESRHGDADLLLNSTALTSLEEGNAKVDKTVKADRATAKKRETLEKQRERMTAKLTERDERIAETRRRAEDDRQAVDAVGTELRSLYTDPDELLKHARVVDIAEIAENEYNLNIPRYVDTFEPEARVSVEEALQGLAEAEKALRTAEDELRGLLKAVGYAV